MLDDACSSGATLLRAIQADEEAGARVEQVMVLLDRQEGGSQRIRETGHRFYSILHLGAGGGIRRGTARSDQR